MASKENVKPPKMETVGEESIADKIKSVKQEEQQRKMEKEVYPPKTPEPVKKAKGGTASSRADGCAMRGKTRGKMY
jgi:hypothetical protein